MVSHYHTALSKPEKEMVVTKCSIKHDIGKHYLLSNHANLFYLWDFFLQNQFGLALTYAIPSNQIQNKRMQREKQPTVNFHGRMMIKRAHHRTAKISEPVEYQLLGLLAGLLFKCMKEPPSKV